jgi:transcription antitermination factor NusG
VSQQTSNGAREKGAKWYAIHTRSNFEARCEEDLRMKGIEPYLPAFEEIHDWKDRRAKVRVPLFANYVFARLADTAEMRVQVLRSAGVVRILGTGNTIEPIPDAELEAIRRILASGRKCQGHPGLLPGTKVTVISGPLRGVEGTLIRIKSESRLQCSVDLLGRSVSVEIDTRDLRPVVASGPRVEVISARALQAVRLEK